MPDENTGWKPAAEVPKLDYYQGWNNNLFDLIPTDCKNVLEIGCAKGMLGDAVKKRNGDIHYTGIEMVEAAARVAKERLDEVHVGNVESFDWSLLSGRSFDCIVFGDVLEHLIEPDKTLLAATRCLSESGTVVCCLPNVSHWSIFIGLIHGHWDYGDSGLLDRTHLRFFTLRTFKELLKECGLTPTHEMLLRTEFDLPQEIVPFLQRVGVDAQEFFVQVSTYQFLIRAKRIPKAASPIPSSSNSGFLSVTQTVAIIIPVSNEVGLTRACLDSIARYYPEKAAPEVTVFDNGSNDGTQAFLEEAQQKFEWLKVIRSGSNLGFARACNKGAELSKADIVVFLSNGVEVQPMWLEKMLDRINDESIGMVGSKLVNSDGTIRHAGIVFSGEGMPTHIHRLSSQSDAAVNRMKEYPAVTGACTMIKRELFLAVGGMDIEYPICYGDVDLCFKVREKGLKVVYQPESTVIRQAGRSPADPEANEADRREGMSIFIRKWQKFMLKEIYMDARFYAAGKDYAPR